MEITKEMIAEWKAKYGKVVKLSFDNVQYYYRPLNIDEYMNIQRLSEADGTNGEVNVVKAGVIIPEIADNPPAGVILRLSDEILKISGFVPDGEPEEL